MAVTRDSIGTEQAFAANTSFSYTGLTIGAGLTNSAAVFVVVTGFSASQSSPPTVSATWNGVSAPLIITQSAQSTGPTTSAAFVSLLGIVNPAAGNKTLAVTVSASAETYIYGVSFANVNQTGGTTTFAHSAGAGANTSSTNLALTLTTANGNWTLVGATIGVGNGASTVQLGGVATQDWFDNSDVGGFGVFGAAGNASSSGTTAAWSAHNTSLDIDGIAGVDIVAASGASLVASWYSPFEGPPNRLKPRPASFQETQTALSTSAPLENHFPSLFDVVSLLKKQTGFVDLEVPPAGAVRPLPAFEPLPPKLILRPPGFQENHTNIQTISAPSYQTALFDPAKPLKLQAGFVDSKIAPAPVAVAAITQDQTFHPAKPLKVQPGFVHLDINVATQAPLTNHFPTFFDPVALQKRPAGFDDRPWPIVPTPPQRTEPFFPVLRLKQNIEFQQQYQNPTITAATPPVFPLSPNFDPSVKLRPPDSSFFYTAQFIFVAPSQLKITDTTHLQLPINAILMGQQDYEEGESIIEASDPNYRTKVKVSFGGGGKLSSNDPTFTTTTSKKGYD